MRSLFSKRSMRHLLVKLCVVIQLGLTVQLAAAPRRSDAGSQKDDQTGTRFAFEVVSIHAHRPGTGLLNTQYLPDGYIASFNLENVILRAYIPQLSVRFSSKIVNAPSWVADDWFDIDARVAPENRAAWQQAQNGVDSELLHSAFQAVLNERFKLAVHLEPIDARYWNLVADKHGARLEDTVAGKVKPIRGKTYALGKGFYIQDNGQRHFVGVSMEELAMILMRLGKDRSVQDKTGLTGRYDFSVPWYDYRQYPSSEIGDPLDRMPISGIGLVLQPGTGPAFLVHVDHIERPDAN